VASGVMTPFSSASGFNEKDASVGGAKLRVASSLIRVSAGGFVRTVTAQPFPTPHPNPTRKRGMTDHRVIPRLRVGLGFRVLSRLREQPR